MFEIEDAELSLTKIRALGVGGCGCNVISQMVAGDITGVDLICINTDIKSLDASLGHKRLLIGNDQLRGEGAGGDPEKGRMAALHDRELLAGYVDGAEIVFVMAGLGGGTGTGAGPVIAKMAKERGIFTIAVVTTPFCFEGKQRSLNAERGIEALRSCVDTYIVLPNDRVGLAVEKGTPLHQAFSMANKALGTMVQGVLSAVLSRGLMSVGMADVRNVMEGGNRAIVGVGRGTGQGAARDAAKQAILTPLFDGTLIERARRVLVQITGGPDMPLHTVDEAASLVCEVSPGAHITLGAMIDEFVENEVRVTVIAAGLAEGEKDTRFTHWGTGGKPIQLRGSGKVLSKEPVAGLDAMSIRPAEGVDPALPPRSTPTPDRTKPEPHAMTSPEDVYDIPTYLRKPKHTGE